MTTPEVLLAARSSENIRIFHGLPQFCPYEKFEPCPSKCNSMCFSKDGKLLSWCDLNLNEVIILNFPSCIEKLRIPNISVSNASFSPQGNCLALWYTYRVMKDSQHGNPNLHIWDMKEGKLLHSFIQKKQSTWKPQWTDNEDICARIVNNEVHFFEENNFQTISKKMYLQKVAAFSISPGLPPYHIASYVPGIKGQPSAVSLYEYPNFEGSHAVKAKKMFYKSDKVEFFWNNTGNCLILLCSTDTDKSGSSYYGEQALHFMPTYGTPLMIKLPKDGPIYALQWSPQSTEFCVVYGNMPAKATIYNQKCEIVFDFGTGPRNLVFYNPHGNMIILAGFGNLRGYLEIWDIKGQKNISTVTASDSTYLSWSPDGQHFLTATTSPRLRIGNGFKIWHYSGSLLYEMRLDMDSELYDVEWQPFPQNTFPQKPISTQRVLGIISSQPEASKEVYRPPCARGQPSKFQLHDNYEAASNMKPKDEANLSKAALKNKKKKEAKKAKKEQEQEKESGEEVWQPSPIIPAVQTTLIPDVDDPEKNKKIKSINKKLEQIAKLKEEQKAGKTLELNQLLKISKEKELLEQLDALYL